VLKGPLSNARGQSCDVRDDLPPEISASPEQFHMLKLGRWSDRNLQLSTSRGVETRA
jgi:hypothetical protein